MVPTDSALCFAHSAEVSGLQWLNTLLQAAWPAALEVLVSNISAERLQEALDKV